MQVLELIGHRWDSLASLLGTTNLSLPPYCRAGMRKVVLTVFKGVGE